MPLSRGSTYSSSDSEDSDADRAILASCSLQEIPQEDLAAILPDQQECDAFEFECNDKTDKNSTQTGDMSGSDMELPQQAVNALIQRTTESSSESESHAPPNPSTLYANSLLQQFVAQTQIMAPVAISDAKPLTSDVQTVSNGDVDTVKRKRGRPRKNEKKTHQIKKNEYCGDPNVSPDSGIQNSPDHVSSPEPGAKPQVQDKCEVKVNNKTNKLSVTSNRFDRLLYGNTDRVLYPPRRKAGRPPLTKKGPGRPPKKTQITEQQAVKPEKADVTKKKTENRPVLATKNKFNNNTKVKYTTLKNSKVMHSKHKHKKHKKYKFKILKPLSSNDPKVVIEIDKLIADFVKFCIIGGAKPPKENVPEIIKTTAKKVSKKRKTTDHATKKKKINVNATVNKVSSTVNNEQRLPLKKRHYLFSDGKTNVKQTKIEEKPAEETSTITATTPKKRHRLEVQTKEKENPQAASKSVANVEEKKNPKPKLSLENLISELKIKRGLSSRNLNFSDGKKVDLREGEPLVVIDKRIDCVVPVKINEGAKKKIRKRRAINRTGFPTVKKKRKKPNVDVDEKSAAGGRNNEETEQKPDVCERVPKTGEECTRFIERSEKIEGSDCKSEDLLSKWEVMSECDSLPQDERIETERSDSVELDEMSLEASIERLRWEKFYTVKDR